MPRLLPVLLVLLAVLAGCRADTATEIPRGFAVAWHSGPTHAARGAHAFIEVAREKSGRYRLSHGRRFLFYSKQDGELREQVVSDGEWDLGDEQVLGLYQLILDEDVAGLERHYRDPEIMDGDYQRLRVSWEGFEKKVAAINTRPEPLLAVHARLRELAGAGGR